MLLEQLLHPTVGLLVRPALPSLYDSLIAYVPTNDAATTAIDLSSTEWDSFAQSFITNAVAMAIIVVSSGVIDLHLF